MYSLIKKSGKDLIWYYFYLYSLIYTYMHNIDA
jgi:hypothetical protein